jgi:hypothetical protein
MHEEFLCGSLFETGMRMRLKIILNRNSDKIDLRI